MLRDEVRRALNNAEVDYFNAYSQLLGTYMTGIELDLTAVRSPAWRCRLSRCTRSPADDTTQRPSALLAMRAGSTFHLYSYCLRGHRRAGGLPSFVVCNVPALRTQPRYSLAVLLVRPPVAQDMAPPKQFMVVVRATRDCGMIMTSRGPREIRMGETHLMPRADAEALIRQGALVDVPWQN